jgi:hypothetical protein
MYAIIDQTTLVIIFFYLFFYSILHVSTVKIELTSYWKMSVYNLIIYFCRKKVLYTRKLVDFVTRVIDNTAIRFK